MNEDASGSLSIANNPTELKLRYYERVLASVPDAIVTIDAAHRITGWNKAAETIYGWTAQEAAGQDIDALLQTHCLTHGDGHWLPHLVDEGQMEVEAVQSTRDGRAITALIRISLLKGETGEIQGFVGILHDITEKKLMEQQLIRQADELREKEHELLEILDGAALGSFIVDLKNNKVLFSSRLRELLGLNGLAEPEQRKLVIDAIHEDDKQATLNYFFGGIANGFPSGGLEHRMKVVGDEYIWVYSKGKMTYDSQGVPEKYYAASYDISDRKKIELQLIEKNRLIVDFFTNISHEFKTPLSIILMDLDLMDRHLEQANCSYREKIDRYVAIMRQNAFRLHRLIANLLDVTKIDAGFLKVRLYKADVVAQLAGLADSVADYARNFGIEVQFSCRSKRFMMPLDADKMERILLNLLSNAIKHTTRGGRVEVRLEIKADSIVISVIDNGSGIPEDKKGIIFDRFKQVNTSLTRDSEGCGIGLSLSKALVELLGGRIWFNSTFGVGSEFFVEIPVMDGQEEENTLQMDGLSTNRMVAMELSDIIGTK